MAVSNSPLATMVGEAFERRVAPVSGLADDAMALAVACRDMAERFARGGRLLVFGNGAGATMPSMSRWSSCIRSSSASGHFPHCRW
jgi:hypothetical protein